jgi:hypothetical protein
LRDQRASDKLEEVRLRRICLNARDSAGKKQVFTLAPSGVMPYSVGYTDEMEKALFLRRFDVPFWALAYVFGRDDGYWYRMENRFGRYEGEKAIDIAKTLGCDDETVRNVIKGFNQNGMAVLKEGSRRPHTIQAAFSSETVDPLKEILHQSPGILVKPPVYGHWDWQPKLVMRMN